MALPFASMTRSLFGFHAGSLGLLRWDKFLMARIDIGKMGTR